MSSNQSINGDEIVSTSNDEDFSDSKSTSDDCYYCNVRFLYRSSEEEEEETKNDQTNTNTKSEL
jgi:hypothetical protein